MNGDDKFDGTNHRLPEEGCDGLNASVAGLDWQQTAAIRAFSYECGFPLTK